YATTRAIRFGDEGPGGPGRRGPGVGNAPGAAAQAPGFQPAQPAQARLTVRWVTGDAEVAAASWEELATKLKAPDAKVGTTAVVHKLRVLNHLGSQGWELVSAGTSTAIPWVFKRRVPK